MGTTAKTFWILGTFFLIMATVYGVVTHMYAPAGLEPAGFASLVFLVLMAYMLAFYLSATNRRRPTDRYDDNPRGEIADAEGDYGFFSPYSWMPIGLAGVAALTVMGVAVGWWMFFLAAGLGVFMVIGWMFEYFTGEHHV